MTNFPNPKAEIVVKVMSPTCLWITAASSDAYNWINDTAGRFGILFPPRPEIETCFNLYVSEVYNANEVADYLRTGGSS